MNSYSESFCVYYIFSEKKSWATQLEVIFLLELFVTIPNSSQQTVRSQLPFFVNINFLGNYLFPPMLLVHHRGKIYKFPRKKKTFWRKLFVSFQANVFVTAGDLFNLLMWTIFSQFRFIFFPLPAGYEGIRDLTSR